MSSNGHESETQIFQQVLEHVFVPLLEQQVGAPLDSRTPTPPQSSPTGVLRSVLKLLNLLQHLDRRVPGACLMVSACSRCAAPCEMIIQQAVMRVQMTYTSSSLVCP